MQLAFLGESDPNFPWVKFPLGQQSVQNTKYDITDDTMSAMLEYAAPAAVAAPIIIAAAKATATATIKEQKQK